MTICYCLYNRCQFRPAVFCHVISKLNQKEWVSTVNILLILKQKTNRNSWCWIKFVLMLWSFFAWPMSQSYAWWHEAFDECFAMFSVFQCWIPVLVGFACVCAVDFPSVQTDVVLEALLLQRWCIFLRVITFVPWNALKLIFFSFMFPSLNCSCCDFGLDFDAWWMSTTLINTEQNSLGVWCYWIIFNARIRFVVVIFTFMSFLL